MSNMIPQYDTRIFTDVWEDVEKFIDDYKHVGIPALISDSNATTLYYLLFARYGNNPIANYDETQFKYKVFSIIFQYGPTWEKRLSVQSTLRGLQLSDLIDDGGLSELFTHTGNSSSNTSNAGTNSKVSSSNTSNTGNVSTSGNNSTENIKNNALNPGTTPAVNAYEPLTYINAQEATKKNDLLSGVTTNDLHSSLAGNESSNISGNASSVSTDAANNNVSRTLTAGKLKGYERLLALLDSDVTGEFISKFRVCFKQFVLPERTWIYVSSADEEEEEDE